MTLTKRLLFFFLGSLALILVGFSSGLYLLARIYLNRQAEERLDAATNTVLAAVEVGPDGVEWEPNDRVHSALGFISDSHFEWFVRDEQGLLVDRSKGAFTETLIGHMRRSPSTELPTQEQIVWQDASWLVTQREIQPTRSVHPVEVEPNDGEHRRFRSLSVVVGIPIGPVQNALRSLFIALVSLSTSVWGCVLVLGGWVCQRALRPVGRIATLARQMQAADLTERFTLTGAGDELDELSESFNGLLDRLKESFDRQKRFTGDASHQLRTPLTIILGQLEVTLSRIRSVEEYERVLAIINRHAHHLRQIVESLLFLARS